MVARPIPPGIRPWRRGIRQQQEERRDSTVGSDSTGSAGCSYSRRERRSMEVRARFRPEAILAALTTGLFVLNSEDPATGSSASFTSSPTRAAARWNGSSSRGSSSSPSRSSLWPAPNGDAGRLRRPSTRRRSVKASTHWAPPIPRWIAAGLVRLATELDRPEQANRSVEARAQPGRRRCVPASVAAPFRAPRLVVRAGTPTVAPGGTQLVRGSGVGSRASTRHTSISRHPVAEEVARDREPGRPAPPG